MLSSHWPSFFSGSKGKSRHTSPPHSLRWTKKWGRGRQNLTSLVKEVQADLGPGIRKNNALPNQEIWVLIPALPVMSRKSLGRCVNLWSRNFNLFIPHQQNKGFKLTWPLRSLLIPKCDQYFIYFLTTHPRTLPWFLHPSVYQRHFPTIFLW